MTTSMAPFEWDEAYHEDPFGTLRRLRESGPVCPAVAPDGSPVWLVTGYQQARAALADPRLSLDKRHSRRGYAGFAMPPALERNLLNMDPPDHTRLRSLVGQAFTARRLEASRPLVRARAAELLEPVAGERADLVAALAAPLPVVVICDLLGVPAGQRRDFRSWTDALVAPTAGSLDPKAAMGEMLAFMLGLIAVKRAEPADDLLSALVAARDADDRLGDEELLSLAFLLLFTGFETTVDLLGTTLLATVADGALRRRLVAEPRLVPAVVEECLRAAPPAPLAIRRFALEDVRIGGVRVPAGDTVMISLAAANRDPARFGDPDALRPERQDGGHLAF